MPHVIYPTPIDLEFRDDPLGVDPQCLGLERVNPYQP